VRRDGAVLLSPQTPLAVTKKRIPKAQRVRLFVLQRIGQKATNKERETSGTSGMRKKYQTQIRKA
jgi:hypothetical protein